MTKNTALALAAALAACLIWSSNFLLARGMHELIPPFAFSFWRWIIAFLALLPFSYPYVRREWGLITANLKYLVFMGLVGVASFNSLIYFAAHDTTTSHIAIISSTTPILTLILAGIVGQDRLTAFKIGGGAMACLGALYVITQGQLSAAFTQDWNHGDILVVISATIWAVWSVGLKSKPAGMSAVTFMTAVSAIGICGLFPFYFWESQRSPVDLLSWNIVGVLLYVGIAASLIAWLCWQNAIERIGPVKTSLIYYSLPLFSSGLAIVFLGEELLGYHVIGFLAVCAGVAFSNFGPAMKAAFLR